MTRREALALAAAWQASAVFSLAPPRKSESKWVERREFYPEGVASAEPTADSVLLWTRRPEVARGASSLSVEVTEDPRFERVLARGDTTARAAADWTARVLIAGLNPACEYWYRFAHAWGNGSRIGRTITAPSPEDPRSVRFAFVSCQNVTQGAQNAYRRMIFEDERAAPDERLDFVLHQPEPSEMPSSSACDMSWMI